MAYGFTVNCDGNAVEQLRKIDAALAQAGVNAKVQVGEISDQFEGMGEKIKSVFSNVKSLLLGGFAGFEAFEWLKSSKDTYDELEKSITRVNTALKSTRYAAGLSNGALQDQAKELAKSIVADQAEILEAQGMQLSFTNIRGDKFKETMETIADFAAFYHEDLNSAALQVDKAVNDPAQGFRRLMREGVTFTAEQEKQIKNYEAQGQLVKAQEVILRELRKEFGGQAKAFAQTDAGREAMDAKQWEEIKLQIGEVISKLKISLIPLFGEVRTYLKEAFDSAPMQFLIGHLKDMLSIGLKIVPMWLAYKGIMLATSLITSVFSVNNGILTASLGEVTVMTDGATVAVEGFGAALSSIGIGAIAVGFGLLVEHLISMNEELDQAIDKKYKLSDTNEFYKNQSERFKSIKERMSMLNDPNMSMIEKQALYTDMQNFLHSTRLKLKPLQETEGGLAHDALKTPPHTGFKHFIGLDLWRSMTDSSYMASLKSRDAFKDQNQKLGGLTDQFSQVKNALDQLVNSPGFKKPKAAPGGFQNGMQTDATDTSELGGPKGGLGEAKIININFHDALQKVTVADGRGVVKSGQEAIEFMISALQNFAYAQSSTH